MAGIKMNVRQTKVNGTSYEVWSDAEARGTFAKNSKTGETKMIKGSGYVSNDVTTRKAIAVSFKEKTFRK
jgi:hypothetical protein